MPRTSPADHVDAAASDWLLRREAGLTERERAEFEQWLAADPRHRAAADRADETWSLLDVPRRAGRGYEMIQALGRRASRRRRHRVVGAAMALAAVVVVALQWHPPWLPVPAVAGPVVAGPEKRVLPDGGVIEFRPGAEVTVDYSGQDRRVTLRSGEALFEVARNKQRPFVVSARDVRVRAVGTAFLVAVKTREVDIVVTDGTVAVERDMAAASVATVPGGQPAPTVVDAGHRVTVDLASDAVPAVVPLSPQDMAARLDWRAPRVTFSDTPLAEAVALINRHSKLQLVIDDPVLGQMPVNGVFRLDNTDTLVRLLEQGGFGVRVERSGETITLRPVR